MAIDPGSPRLAEVRRSLAEGRLLMLHDAIRPSLTTLVAGTPIRGSWWGHPAGGEIFRVASALEDDGEVAFVPLIAGKVTLVHRALWADLAAVGESRETWQLDGLDRGSRALLAEVERAGRLRASGPPAKALARALLVHAAQVHTERGAHATELQTWQSFRKEHRLGRRRAVAVARQSLESAVERALGAGTLVDLPWRARR
jgi:hypothetical protein